MMGSGPWIEVGPARGPPTLRRYSTITPAQPLAAVLSGDQKREARGLGREAGYPVESANVPSLFHALAEHGPIAGTFLHLTTSTEA